MEARSFWYFVAQAVVVGFGWVVVHWLSERRDKNKARFEAIAAACDGLMDDTNGLLTGSREYHLRERGESAEVSIKMTIQDMTAVTLSLSSICSDRAGLAQCRSQIALARRKITGQHFEDEHVSALAVSDSQLEDIALAILQLKQSILRVKYNQIADTRPEPAK